jgi:HlyD family secretion protein
MEGDLVLDSYPDQKLKGTIKTISFVPQQGETGTVYAIKLLLNADNANFLYRIGMTGDANFIIRSKDNALFVPSRFISEENDKKYVTVMEKGKRIKKKVTTGIETDEDIEITSGLTAGDVVYD